MWNPPGVPKENPPSCLTTPSIWGAAKTVPKTKYMYLSVFFLFQDLKWNTHISKVIANGYRTLGFLKQNLRVNSPTLKAKAYTSILHPQLEYCSAVGDPTVENSGSYKLEMVQPWGTRWALGRYQQSASAQLENFRVEKSWWIPDHVV